MTEHCEHLNDTADVIVMKSELQGLATAMLLKYTGLIFNKAMNFISLLYSNFKIDKSV